jgi:protein TonB
MAGTLTVAATSKALPPHSPATSTPTSAGDTSGSPAAPASPAQSGAETSPEELTLPGGGATAAAVAPREGGSVARRFKRYPPLARERGWEGTVEVALNVRSGRTLPEGLRGGGFRVLLPVRFSLESEP